MVGVDIGGTHTDLIIVDTETGQLSTAKVPTTPGDQAVGLMSGLAALQADPAAIDLLIHGTTVATNAVIERQGRPLRPHHHRRLPRRAGAAAARPAGHLRPDRRGSSRSSNAATGRR